LIIRRGLAAFIDYSFIILYALLLFGIATLVGLADAALPPLAGQLLGMLSLTIPAVTCFIIWEKGPYRATPGKRIMGLVVVSDDPVKHTSDVIRRNILKFMPWEIAHTGLHWLFYYDRMRTDIPLWVMILLIVPQLIVFVYLLSILLEKNGRSLYDRWSDTRVMYKADLV
jgi:uncharacterized RDD family membrane protein YckC